MTAAQGAGYGATVAIAAFAIAMSLQVLGYVALDPYSRRWRAEKRRADEAEVQLADARRREQSAVNLLADQQDREHPFPEAGSLVDEVEAWLRTPPTSED